MSLTQEEIKNLEEKVLGPMKLTWIGLLQKATMDFMQKKNLTVGVCCECEKIDMTKLLYQIQVSKCDCGDYYCKIHDCPDCGF